MDRSRPMRLAALIAIVALLLGACASPATTPASEESESAHASASHAQPGESAAESASAEATGAASGEVEVTLGLSSFSPGSLTIDAGTSVVFNNSSGLPHTVTHGSDGRAVDDPAFDRPVDDGAKATITFDEPGTYEVTCKIHPTMNMTITVEG